MEDSWSIQTPSDYRANKNALAKLRNLVGSIDESVVRIARLVTEDPDIFLGQV